MGFFLMPSRGAGMEAGTVVEWLKKEGDEVHRNDVIAVIETQKGAIEVEVFEDGPLTRLLVQPGAKVAVGTPLAVIGTEETVPVQDPASEQSQPPSPPLSMAMLSSRATPAARQLARKRGVDLAGVNGSGPGGTVTLADVEHAKAGRGGSEPMRVAIAAAVARSKREIPHYYLAHSIDISPVIVALGDYNRAHPPHERLLLIALLVKAVAEALHDFPELNGFCEAGEHRASEAIHVGVAIAMRGGGLIAPAIHDTDKLSLRELMTQIQDLVVRVRRGSFRSSEISDPTVTVSSLGERGVDGLFPVIYPPQVAIVGFGAPRLRPWINKDGIAQRHIIDVSLAGDHRISDGHRGALFLRRLADVLSRMEQI